MTKSKYITQPAEKSFCPTCHTAVTLLAREDCQRPGCGQHPWFYICWTCKSVAQVGVGPVETVHDQLVPR